MTSKQCPINTLILFLSKKWTLHILHLINSECITFSGLQKALGSISTRTLSIRLNELEGAHLIERKVIDARPPKVLYTPTQKSAELYHIISQLNQWAQDWTQDGDMNNSSGEEIKNNKT